MNDYEVLGLKPGADEKEVKQAYFRLVRQFPPEKDPDRFQQIRQAYEHLKDGTDKKILRLTVPDIPLAKRMYEQITNAYKRNDYRKAIDTAEEAIGYYGEYDGFLFYLAISQLENGNSGKAAQNFEKLLQKSPDNVFFAQRLAQAYSERGFSRKAYVAFAKAYQMGCRDIDFLKDYSYNCLDRGDGKTAVVCIKELLKIASSDKKKYMPYLIDAHYGLYVACTKNGVGDLDSIWKDFCQFLDDSSAYMSGYEEMLHDVIGCFVIDMKRRGRFQQEDGRRLCSILMRGLGRAKTDEMWEDISDYAQRILIKEDDRISETWLAWFELTLDPEYTEVVDKKVMRFLELDAKLCILEEWPRMRGEAEIIKEEYPVLYEIIKEYVDTLKLGNRDYLRGKMLSEYERLGRYLPEGEYEKRYGNRRRQKQAASVEELITESLSKSPSNPLAGASAEAQNDVSAKPYVRDMPKIGRNDPCPCGSGKKYKKCCGRK